MVSFDRSLLKGEAPRFSADFNHPLLYERPFKFPRHLVGNWNSMEMDMETETNMEMETDMESKTDMETETETDMELADFC